ASSYNQALGVARRIPAGQPEYYRAQASIDQWSQRILRLAESRASSGQLGQALQTAALVPPDTAAAPAAKQAILIWKRRLGG
ncbi:MAG: peptidase C14, partial [Cyanobacteria bacterium P01_H01_bin.130]